MLTQLRLAADGARLALTTLTVVPVPGCPHPDRRVAGRAMALAPLVGLLLGAIAAAADLLPGLIGPVAAIAALALLTRGLHLDGLADTADGLGTHGPPDRAWQVMKAGPAGPFGVATLVLVILGQVAGASAGRPVDLLLAGAASRTMIAVSCLRGIPAGRPGGLGATVAGTVPRTVAAVLLAALLAGSALLPRGPVAVAAALAVTAAVLWHTRRRLGGISGDVLGAVVELSTLAVLLIAR